MSGLCGWYRPACDSHDVIRTLERMTAALAFGAAEHHRTTMARAGAIGCSGREIAFDFAESEGRQIVCGIFGMPKWGDARLAPEAARDGVPRTFVRAYEIHGTGALGMLEGAFSLALIDERRGEVLLATDRFAICPLAYMAANDGLFVFGTSIAAIVSHPEVSTEMDRQALFDYVYFHMIPGPRSAMRGIRWLLPGGCVIFRGGRVEVKSYWEMEYVESETVPFDVLKLRFTEALRAGVARAAEVGSVGAFLSGGTDSSTIAGLLTAVRGEPAKTFSIGFDAEGYDEMAYARIAARHFGTQQFEYYVTPADVVSAIPRIADAYEQPFGNASAVPTYYCARLAANEGVTHMLGGDGGDELFGGNARYSTQYLLSLYSELPEPLRAKLIEPLVSRLPDGDRLPGVRKLRNYIRLASMPVPARLEYYNLVERLGVTRIFTEEFLSATDDGAPIRELSDAYGRAHAQSLINHMLALDLKYTLADNDLRKVTRMCDLAGVECSFPMLDERVVTFSAHLAPHQKLRGTRLRYFFKRALADFLPKEILSKRKHGFGLPFGVWITRHEPLRALAFDSLSDLKQRGIIRPDFIDELTSVHIARHASYFGVMVWVLMMLEQWFKRHVDVHGAFAVARMSQSTEGIRTARALD